MWLSAIHKQVLAEMRLTHGLLAMCRQAAARPPSLKLRRDYAVKIVLLTTLRTHFVSNLTFPLKKPLLAAFLMAARSERISNLLTGFDCDCTASNQLYRQQDNTRNDHLGFTKQIFV
jgi:hypothetical protein